MGRKALLPILALATALALVAGCSSSSSSKSASPTTASGGITATTTAASGTKVSVIVNDKSGLNGPMTLTATPTSVPAGDVTFEVKNTGTIEHEVLLMKLDSGQTWDKIPVTDAGDPPAKVTTGADKIDEANNLAETGDPNLKPGDSRTFVAKGLKAGHYALVCNIAKHYGLGMRAEFEVQ